MKERMSLGRQPETGGRRAKRVAANQGKVCFACALARVLKISSSLPSAEWETPYFHKGKFMHSLRVLQCLMLSAKIFMPKR